MNLALRSAGTRAKPGNDHCSCGEKATFLCDFRLKGPARKGGWRTCDKPLCSDHASYRGGDTHYCPPHAKKASQ